MQVLAALLLLVAAVNSQGQTNGITTPSINTNTEARNQGRTLLDFNNSPQGRALIDYTTPQRTFADFSTPVTGISYNNAALLSAASPIAYPAPIAYSAPIAYPAPIAYSTPISTPIATGYGAFSTPITNGFPLNYAAYGSNPLGFAYGNYPYSVVRR